MNHDSSKPLGRTTAGRLTLAKDDRGLAVDIAANEDVSYVADVLQLIRRGDADAGSFGFEVIDDVWTMLDDVAIREVLDLRLIEVSTGVTFPSYPTTRLSVRRAY